MSQVQDTQTEPPFPVVARILKLINRLSSDWSLTEIIYNKYRLEPRSSFVEYLILGRFGFLVAFLCLGYRPVKLLRHSPWACCLAACFISLVLVYALLEICIALLRLQLIHRRLKSAYDPSRSLVLAYINILEAAVIFAGLYQVWFYAYPDLARAAPLAGSGILKEGTANEAALSPINSLYFSVVTLSTMGYGDIYPQALGYRILVMAEWLVGLLLLIIMLSLTLQLFPQRGQTNKDTHDESQSEAREYLESLIAREGVIEAKDPRLARNLRFQRRFAWIGIAVGMASIVIEGLWMSVAQ